MHKFFKNTQPLLVLLLAGLLSSSLDGVTIHGEPLEKFVHPGEPIGFCFPENSIILLQMKNDDIGVREICLNKAATESLRESFDKFYSRSVRYTISGTVPNVINYENMHLKQNEIELNAPILLDLINCILEAPYILMAGNRINLEDCFLINTQVLHLRTNKSSLSNYRKIQIVFYDKPQSPTIISGEIDFFSSNTEKTLCLTNVKEMIIDFNPRIWNK